MSNSLQRRLNVGLLAGLLLLFVIQAGVVAWVIRDLNERTVISRLEHDAEALLSLLVVDEKGGISLPEHGTAFIYARPLSGHYYQIMARKQVLISPSLWDKELPAASLPTGEQRVWYDHQSLESPLLLLGNGYRKGNVAITIAVAEDVSDLQSILARFLWNYAAVSFVAFIALVLWQSLVLAHGLKPLRRMQQDIRALLEGRKRQLDADVPAEVAPLVGEFNHLLEGVSRHLEFTRNGLADLAHSLKTPLAGIMRLADRLPAAEREPLLEAARRMNERVEYTLRRARFSGVTHPLAQVDLNQELELLAKTLRMIHQQRGLMLMLDTPESLLLAADREEMLELAGNLLDNACKFARSRVLLTARYADGQLTLSVEDDGPGVPAVQRESLVQRGVRLDEQVEGHGLGLAIVSQIVAALHGQVEIGDSLRLGGARVTLQLLLHRTE